LTGGATIAIIPTRLNDFRANWSRTTGTTINVLSNFDGDVPPPTSTFFPPGSPYSFGSGQATIAGVCEGTLYNNVQRQLNFVDTFSSVVGAHQLKFGIDYRRLNPTGRESLSHGAFTSGFQDLVDGNVSLILLVDKFPLSVNVNNYSLFAQDTWKATNHLTLTYGLRWEINPAPVSASSGLPLYAVQGVFDSNPLALVREPPWRTQFSNFAPRIGAAWQVTPKTVVRGGFGLFYDLGYGNIGDASSSYPYERDEFNFLPSPLPFDLSNPLFQPIPFSTTVTASQGGLFSVVGQFGFPQERGRMLALKPHVSQKSKRLTRKSRMTFVVGLKCRIGIVLCSDSQELDGISKRNIQKLRFYQRRGEWGIAWGCSGESDIIGKFNELMDRTLKNEPREDEDPPLTRIPSLIEKIVLSLKENYPGANLAIVCGFWQELGELAFRLYSMDMRINSCIAQSEDYACAGLDTSLALFALESLHNSALAIGEGIGLAVFATKLIKDTAEGVGGPTQMLTYRIAKSQWKEYVEDYVNSIEGKYKTEEIAELLRGYWGRKNPSWLPPLG
jgi:20S proteasome alpha/beta subunit